MEATRVTEGEGWMELGIPRGRERTKVAEGERGN